MHKIYCINDNIISSKIYPALLITLFWVLFVLIFFLFLRRGGEEVGVYYFLLKKTLLCKALRLWNQKLNVLTYDNIIVTYRCYSHQYKTKDHQTHAVGFPSIIRYKTLIVSLFIYVDAYDSSLLSMFTSESGFIVLLTFFLNESL